MRRLTPLPSSQREFVRPNELSNCPKPQAVDRYGSRISQAGDGCLISAGASRAAPFWIRRRSRRQVIAKNSRLLAASETPNRVASRFNPKLPASRDMSGAERDLSQRDDMDLKKLNDDELELLERLLQKAAGKLVGDVVPPFESSSSMLPSRPLM